MIEDPSLFKEDNLYLEKMKEYKLLLRYISQKEVE